MTSTAEYGYGLAWQANPHLSGGGARLKSVRSHLSALVPQSRSTADPGTENGEAVEVDRTVSKDGGISLAGHLLLAAEMLSGRRVSIRIDGVGAPGWPAQPV